MQYRCNTKLLYFVMLEYMYATNKYMNYSKLLETLFVFLSNTYLFNTMANNRAQY